MTVRDIFDSMDYGPAPESAAEALAWLASHANRFGHWIDGTFTDPGTVPGDTFETRNPATGKTLAQVTQGTPADLDLAVEIGRASCRERV